MNNNLDIKKIFERVKNKEITSKEAYQLIKNSNNSNSDKEIIYFETERVNSEIENKTSIKEIGNILIFAGEDSNVDNCKDQLNDLSKLKIVKAGNSFTKINNNEYIISPESKTDYMLLFSELKKENFIPETVINLWSLDNIFKEMLELSELNTLLDLSLYSIFHIVNALNKLKIRNLKRFLVGLDKDSNPIAKSIKGFTESFNISMPHLIFQTVEIDEDNDYMENILRELIVLDNISVDITYGSKRYIRNLQETRLINDSNVKLKNKGVYLITGGTGGLGRVFASYLAKKYNATLILTGRSELNEKKDDIINTIRDLGGEVLYLQADVGNIEDMKKVIKVVKEKYGNLNGILHTSGLNSITGILKKDFKEFKNILWPKIQGTIVLDEVTKDMGMDFLLLFSSVASVLGDFGQGDYAVSNKFLDEFVSYRNNLKRADKRKGITKSISWPLWRDGGMHLDNDVERLYLQSSGLSYLENEEGFTIVENLLGSNKNHVIVFKGNRSKINRFISSKNNGKKLKAAFKKNSIKPQNKSTDLSIEKRIEADVVSIASGITKIPVSKLDIDENMGDFGFDSIGLKEFSDGLAEHFQIEISPVIFFDLSTLRELKDFLIKEHKGDISNIYKENEEDDYVVIEDNISDTINVIVDEKELEVKNVTSNKKEPVAIIGISGILPKSKNVNEFWSNLEQEKDLISEIPLSRWDWEEYYNNSNQKHEKFSKWAGLIEDIDKFDAKFFNLSPKEAECMDPQQRLFLQSVWSTIEDAGYKVSNLSGRNVGVFVGIQPNEYQQLFNHGENIHPLEVTGNANSLISNRISYLFNFRGPSESIDTACSSSLVALNRGVKSIQCGESEVAIVGGVSLMVSPNVFVGAIKLGVLSPDGRCKTFDKSANGYVRGEGVGAVLLKPLSKAIEDKDNIYAVIKGSAEGHGGKANSLTAPNSDAQASLLKRAYEDAGISPESISYLEAHGTGTELGDPVEIQGLKKVFNYKSKKYCGIGSVKTNIGHLEPASGMAGLLKVILSMEHKKLPALLHFKEQNPLINLDNTPFYIVDKTMPWEKIVDEDGNELPRRAGISSFGFGGAYAHVVLEEYESNNILLDNNSEEVIILSAKTEEALKEHIVNLLNFLKVNKDTLNLKEIAYTLQTGRESMNYRLALIAKSKDELINKLDNYINRGNINSILFSNVKKIEKHGIVPNKLEELINNEDILTLVDLWIKGINIDWGKLYKSNKPKKISLPTYPFARNSFWAPKEEKKSTTHVKNKEKQVIKNDIKSETIYYNYDYVKSDIKNNIEQALVRLVVFDTDNNIGDVIKDKVDELIVVKKGKEFRKINDLEYEMNPVVKEDYVQLIKAIKEDKKEPTHIIHLWSYEKEDVISSRINNSFISIFGLSYGLIKEKLENKVKIIYTYNNSPEYEAVSTLLKTVCLENSKINYKTIGLNVNNTEKIDKILLTELNEKSKDVKYLEERYVKTINEIVIENNNNLIKDKGVYIITGGLGGLGFIFAKHLAKKYKARLVLTGRSELDSKKEEKISQLKDFGAEVIYVKGNLCNKEDVDILIEKTREVYRGIHGIIHSAGVINDAYIINKKEIEMESVIAPKVYGTTLLDEATKDDKLDFFVTFSSVTAVLGNVGQADYAYANSFMDNFAKVRDDLVSKNQRFGKSISINWPLWRDGGMHVDSQTEKFIENSFGFKLLETTIGIQAFEDSLKQDNNQFIVLCGNKEKISNTLGISKKNKAFTGMKINMESLIKTLEEDIKGIVSEVLKIKVKEIDLNENMSEYGFDSISFTEFGNKLNDKYDITIIPAIFYEHNTLNSLIKYLAEEENEVMTRYYHDLECEVYEEVSVTKNEIINESIKETNITNNISEKKQDEPIAIVGVSGIMPQADNLDDFWNILEGEKNAITEIPKDRWDWEEIYGDPLKEDNKTNIKWGGFVKDVDKFDATFFGISEEEAKFMDPQHRLFLETVWKAVEDAGYSSKDISGTNTGVFVGVGLLDYGEVVNKTDDKIYPQISTGMSNCMVPNRVSYMLDLRGPSEPIDTACASSLSAIHRAVQEIQLGNCDMAIAGGVKLILSPTLYIAFSKAGMLSEDGKCKTFDKDANGYVRGEGVGAVILKPLSKAVEDNDNIYAVIKGTAVNHGGHVNSLTTPNPNAQADVIYKAWKKAGVNPTTIDYIETYGSGTTLGDSIEINGLKKAFKQLHKEWNSNISKSRYCGLGSVKTNIGHLESASGMAGLIKVLLAIKNKKLPASINFNEINPYIKLEESPFYIVDSTKNWEQKGGEPRRAGVSAFGHGGVNAHIALEEYVMPHKAIDDNEPQVIVLSAKNKDRLKVYAKEIIDFITNKDSANKVYGGDIKSKLESDLRKATANIINVSAKDISISENMDEYGFDPINVIELFNNITRKYSINNWKLSNNEYTSIERLTDYLFNNYFDSVNEYYRNTNIGNEIKTQEISLGDMAYTLQVGRDSMTERLAVVASSLEELKEKLSKYIGAENYVEDLYIGSTSNNSNTNLLINGEEGKVFIKTVIKNNNLDKVAQLWVTGVEIDWNELHINKNVRRIPLPTYPFERERHWIS